MPSLEGPVSGPALFSLQRNRAQEQDPCHKKPRCCSSSTTIHIRSYPLSGPLGSWWSTHGGRQSAVRASTNHLNAHLCLCTANSPSMHHHADHNLSFRNMKLLLPLLASLHLALAQKIIAEQGVDVTVHPSDGSITIDVRVDVDSALPVPAHPGNASSVAANATRSPPPAGNRHLLVESTVRSLCAPESRTSDASTSSRLPTAATQGAFPNSTSSSLVSASARPPFPVEFAAFSGGFSASSQSSLSLLTAVASCCVGMVAVL